MQHGLVLSMQSGWTGQRLPPPRCASAMARDVTRGSAVCIEAGLIVRECPTTTAPGSGEAGKGHGLAVASEPTPVLTRAGPVAGLSLGCAGTLILIFIFSCRISAMELRSESWNPPPALPCFWTPRVASMMRCSTEGSCRRDTTGLLQMLRLAAGHEPPGSLDLG